jgi:hypothetical protein
MTISQKYSIVIFFKKNPLMSADFYNAHLLKSVRAWFQFNNGVILLPDLSQQCINSL